MTLAKNKNLLIGLGVIIIAAVVYVVFFNGSDTADLTASATGSAEELYFVNLAGQLGAISFDTAIFSDPHFAALVDIRTAVIPEEPGRPDPFAPVPGVKGTSK